MLQTHAVKAPLLAALGSAQLVQLLDCEPATLNVLAAQLATTALAVLEHELVTRWPAPAVEQAVHDDATPAAFDAGP